MNDYERGVVRVLLQRVSSAAVQVDGECVGRIAAGLLLFVGVGRGDGEAEVEWLVKKISSLRVFRDDEGRMNRSLIDVEGEALVVSQFTLFGECDRGTRPSFSSAGPPDQAVVLLDNLVAGLRRVGIPRVETGRFGADMKVELVNDGPVTLWLERRPAAPKESLEEPS